MNQPETPPELVTRTERDFALAKKAIHHVLNAIADDPRKFWLMGDMTGSYENLTAAAAAIWNKPVEEIKAAYRPRKEEWERYLKQREETEALLTYCHENGIKVSKS